MIESHLVWNTKKPKYEDVEGKMVVICWKNNASDVLRTESVFIHTVESMESYFSGMMRYAIISTGEVTQ